MTSASRASGAGHDSPSSPSSSNSSPTRPPRDDSRPLLPRSPSSLLFPTPPAPPPLHITIRFSTALPDLHLDIASPHQTTVVALKHLIRGRLAADAEAQSLAEAEAEAENTDDEPSPHAPRQPSPAAQAAQARLRFIHNGRILPDASVLSAVLRAPPPPPLSHHPDPRGKSPAGVHHQQQRVFVNCSIGDALPPADLKAEAAAASAPVPPPASPSTTPHPSTPSRSPAPRLAVVTTNLPSHSATTQNNTTTTANLLHPRSAQPGRTTTTATTDARPQGFDRLAQAGLTSSEISTLRSHFRAIHTARFTPDAMPSPDALRAMEDAWLDNDSLASSRPAATAHASPSGLGTYPSGAGAALAEEHDDDAAAAAAAAAAGADDAFGLNAVAGPLIKGMLIGFVFPLGVIGWLGKEDGVWSRRMQFFVVFGVLLSVSVGMVRGLTGEG